MLHFYEIYYIFVNSEHCGDLRHFKDKNTIKHTNNPLDTMKKLFLILAVILGVVSVSAKNNYSRDVNILPAEAQTILKDNFKSGVSHIKIGKDFGHVREYDVVMTDGSEISFDKHGNWKEVDVAPTSSVPSDLIPNPIMTFVNENQSKAKVTSIEKKNYGYEVELSNGIDVRFTEKGKFIRYDE